MMKTITLLCLTVASATAFTASTLTLPTSSSPTTTSPTNDDLRSLLPTLQDGFQRIFLLRHGETDWNKAGRYQGGGVDLRLNENGKRQAHFVANWLQPQVKFDVVASSHLQRSKDTAACVLDYQQQHNNDIVRIVDDGFGEMKFGDFLEGITVRGPNVNPVRVAAFRQYMEAMQVDRSLCFPGGGESFGQVEDRLQSALNRLVESHPQAENLCIVAHGRANKILLSALLEGAPVKQGNTCVNVLDRCKRTGRCEAHLINYTGHIE